jgi:hypothetical protein
MLDKIEYATRQALAARQSAAEALDNKIRQDWELVAEMWEALVHELRELQQERTKPAPEA